jgi:hypothetical protein
MVPDYASLNKMGLIGFVNTGMVVTRASWVVLEMISNGYICAKVPACSSIHLKDFTSSFISFRGCHSFYLHLRLDFCEECFQLVHIRLLLRPANHQAFFLVRLGDLRVSVSPSSVRGAVKLYHVKMDLNSNQQHPR